MATLGLLSDDGTIAERWDLEAQPLAVGRDDSADVVIEDDALSRRHFLIVREGNDYLLTDLDSSNGTFVDGKSARVSRLRHHDCILAGRTLFIFCEESSNAPDGRNSCLAGSALA